MSDIFKHETHTTHNYIHITYLPRSGLIEIQNREEKKNKWLKNTFIAFNRLRTLLLKLSQNDKRGEEEKKLILRTYPVRMFNIIYRNIDAPQKQSKKTGTDEYKNIYPPRGFIGMSVMLSLSVSPLLFLPPNE